MPLVDLSAFEEHNRLSNVWYGTIRSAIMKISCVLLPMDGSIRYAFPPWDLIRRVLGTRTEGNRRQDVSDSTCLPNQPHLLNDGRAIGRTCWRVSGQQDASLLEKMVDLVQGPSQSASRCLETIRRR